MPHCRTPLIAALLSLILTQVVLADTPAGEAVAVDPQASGTLQGAAQTLPIAAGDGIFLGQTVVTGNTGEVQVVFSDDTHLVIGPDSSLVISQYMMRNDGSLVKFVIDILGGTFRFLTGDSRNEVYEITTPLTTIAVRGTAFDLTVDKPTGTSELLLYHGGVTLCGDGGCRTLAEACAVAVVAPRQTAKIVPHGDGRRTRLLASFPYLQSQSSLKRGFRINGDSECRTTKIEDQPEGPRSGKPPNDPKP